MQTLEQVLRDLRADLDREILIGNEILRTTGSFSQATEQCCSRCDKLQRDIKYVEYLVSETARYIHHDRYDQLDS